MRLAVCGLRFAVAGCSGGLWERAFKGDAQSTASVEAFAVSANGDEPAEESASVDSREPPSHAHIEHTIHLGSVLYVL